MNNANFMYPKLHSTKQWVLVAGNCHFVERVQTYGILYRDPPVYSVIFRTQKNNLLTTKNEGMKRDEGDGSEPEKEWDGMKLRVRQQFQTNLYFETQRFKKRCLAIENTCR